MNLRRVQYRTLRVAALAGIASAFLWACNVLASVDDPRAMLGALASLMCAIAANNAAIYYDERRNAGEDQAEDDFAIREK